MLQLYTARHINRASKDEKLCGRPVKEMIREFRVDGIVGERLVFCDFWTAEHYLLSKEIKAQTPYLMLDREYLWGGAVGQLRTRAQAFLETLER